MCAYTLIYECSDACPNLNVMSLVWFGNLTNGYFCFVIMLRLSCVNGYVPKDGETALDYAKREGFGDEMVTHIYMCTCLYFVVYVYMYVYLCLVFLCMDMDKYMNVCICV